MRSTTKIAGEMGHGHTHHGSAGLPVRPRSEAEQGRLLLVLIITAGFMGVEVVGGIFANSLALLADAGHMLTDVGALALSLWAIKLARRPANAGKTYGYVRLEILAALVNGATLLGMSGFIAQEAWRRIRNPVVVDGPLLAGVALGGLVVNVAAAKLLHAHAAGSLNAGGAYLHVLGDLMGSIGALVVWATGWTPADSVVSVLIASLILFSSVRLMREAAPGHVDVTRLLEDLRDVPELHHVHDLHVWTLTSGFVALSAHGVDRRPVPPASGARRSASADAPARYQARHAPA